MLLEREEKKMKRKESRKIERIVFLLIKTEEKWKSLKTTCVRDQRRCYYILKPPPQLPSTTTTSTIINDILLYR